MTAYTKDPDATERFTVDWSDRLDGDTISTATWSQSPSGLTLSGDTSDDTSASTLVSGGTIGDTHTITNRITTSGGETLDQSFTLTIQPA